MFHFWVEKSRREGRPGVCKQVKTPVKCFPVQCHLLSSSLCTSDWPRGCTEMPRGLETTFTWQQTQAQSCWKPPGILQSWS